MLRFLSSLFTSSSEERSDIVDEALLQKAIERVVTGTDPRLRAVGQYQKRLRDPVLEMIVHVSSLVDALPPPIEISPRAYGEDPRLRAFFVSSEHMREVFAGFNTVRDYLTELDHALPEEIFGLLTMVREERNVFAMELDGDTVRRDVMQVAVNFSNHRYLGPSGSERDTRRELKKRAFDFLVERALERITEERSKRRELDRQRVLLKQKLDAMKSGHWGLGTMLNDRETERPDLAALESEIEAIDAELGEFRTDSLGLEDSLECVSETLAHPRDWLAVRQICLRVDYRGIMVPDSSAAPANEMVMTELFSRSGDRRTILLGRLARTDIPEPPDFWEGAKRYL